MPDTKILSNNAVGRITSGAKPNKAMSARYPLAPPCPTDAYKNATSRSKTPNKGVISVCISHGVDEMNLHHGSFFEGFAVFVQHNERIRQRKTIHFIRFLSAQRLHLFAVQFAF